MHASRLLVCFAIAVSVFGSRSFAAQPGTFNVIDYGADPTGSTDSTTQIQAALNAAGAIPDTIIGVEYPDPAVRHGGTVVFPKGQYTVTAPLKCRHVRLEGALGTEIQALLPDSLEESFDVFELYGNCEVKNLWLDTVDSFGPLCTDVSGNDGGLLFKWDLTWFVAKEYTDNGNTPGEEDFSTIILDNIRTSRYNIGGCAKSFFRQEHSRLTLWASNIWFNSWKYGFQLRNSWEELKIQNCMGVGSNTTEGYADTQSAFVVADSTYGELGVALIDCHPFNYYAGVRLDGPFPNAAWVNMQYCGLEGNRFGIVFGDHAAPSLTVLNCGFASRETNVKGDSLAPENMDTYPDNKSTKRIGFEDCWFSFQPCDDTLGLLSKFHVNLVNRKVPISFTNCEFLGFNRWGYDLINSTPPSFHPLVYIGENGGTAVTFNDNRIYDSFTGIANRPPYSAAPVYFDTTKSRVIANGNWVNAKALNGDSMGCWGLTASADAFFTATGNDTLGSISIRPLSTPVNRYTLSGNTVETPGATANGILTTTLDFPAIGQNSVAELTVTVTGVSVGDCVTVTPGDSQMISYPNLTWSAYVSAANTIRVRLANTSNFYSADPPPMLWAFLIRKP